jgi:hypothetical protein
MDDFMEMEMNEAQGDVMELHLISETNERETQIEHAQSVTGHS